MERKKHMMHNPVAGILYVLLLFATASLGTIFFMLPSLLILPFAPRIFRAYNDMMLGMWLFMPVSVGELIFGVKIFMTGDCPQDESSVVMFNHRTYWDWYYYFHVLARKGGLSQCKIILKRALRFVHGTGWACQFGAFIFISRKWEQDVITLKKMLGLYASIPDYKYRLLIMPEGTDFCAKSKGISDRFAEKNGLPKYDFVIHPRTTGFSFCGNYLREKQVLDAIYDVTIGYVGSVPGRLDALARGVFPDEVHFNLERFPVASLPLGEEGLARWCEERWARKEEKLRQFYGGMPASLATPTPYVSTGIPFGHPHRPYKTSRMLCILNVVFWVAFLFAVGYAIRNSYLVMAYTILGYAFLWWNTVSRDGIEGLETSVTSQQPVPSRLATNGHR